MKKIALLLLIAGTIIAAPACNHTSKMAAANAAADTLRYPDESRLKNIRQLTFGGDNAEAYWSYDGKYLVFQRTNPKEGINCDQIFVGKVPTKAGEPFTYKMVSTGTGRTTCPFFTKDGKHIIYASTHLGSKIARPLPIVPNTAINISGRCMTATIFLWPTWMVR